MALNFSRLRQAGADSQRVDVPVSPDTSEAKPTDRLGEAATSQIPNVDEIKFEISDRLLSELNPAIVLGLAGDEGRRHVTRRSTRFCSCTSCRRKPIDLGSSATSETKFWGSDRSRD